jgi:dolichyl-phosphate-mannose--protein O-mannosyl transferase
MVFFSLGFSTKWIAFFGLAAQIILLLWMNKNLRSYNKSLEKLSSSFSPIMKFFLLLILVGGVIYLLSYVPYMALGHSLKDVYDRQWSMLSYHSGLTASHPYSSPWWSWPLMIKPVWLYFSELSKNQFSSIAAMGNPAVWWMGLMSVVMVVYRAFRVRDLNSTFLSVVFFLQWLPYAFFSRVLFLYHYYSNVPVLCLATVFFLEKIWGEKRGKWISSAYLIIVAALFLVYHPVISGHPTNYWFRDLLRVFESWAF